MLQAQNAYIESLEGELIQRNYKIEQLEALAVETSDKHYQELD